MPAALKPPASFGGVIVTQAIAIVFFVAMPVVVTLMVPFTDLEFRQSGGKPSVAITRYVLMFVPWQHRTVSNVREVRAEVTKRKRYANTSENRRKGRAGNVSHPTGQLVIVGDGPERVVQASPELARETEARFRAFAATGNPAPARLSLHASWSLSYLLGGTVSFLFALYVAGAAMAILTWPIKAARARISRPA